MTAITNFNNSSFRYSDAQNKFHPAFKQVYTPQAEGTEENDKINKLGLACGAGAFWGGVSVITDFIFRKIPMFKDTMYPKKISYGLGAGIALIAGLATYIKLNKSNAKTYDDVINLEKTQQK